MSTAKIKKFPYLSVTKAAEAIGVCGQRIRQLLDSGELEGVQPDGPGTAWYIPVSEIKRYKSIEPPTTGRPRAGTPSA